MKFDNKTFQQKYEAWKNGADYWKDIRGINLGQQAQEEPSEEEQKKLDNQVTSILAEYNRGKGNQISVSPQQAYWNHMMKAGVDPIVAAGIAGNIQQESSFNHRASNGTHWGLVQTDKNLTDYIKKAYGDFSRDSQMNFISDMAMGTPRQIKHKMYNEVLSRSKAFRGEKYKTAQDAAKGWEIYFERSGGSGVGKRQKYASNIYNKYYHPMPTAAQLAEQNIQASPIMQNTPSIKQPQTINAAIPRTLLGPTTNQNSIDARNLIHRKMYEEITTPTLPNVLNLLPTNNFGKDAYGQKFWWRRGNNLHFDEGKDEVSNEGINRPEDKQQISWMRNWLKARKNILKKNAEATTWGYEKYYAKDTSKPVGKMGWDSKYYSNIWNPITYLEGSNPTDNRVNKIIYSQVENAMNVPKVNVGNEYHPYGGEMGVYVDPDNWDNSGHYVAFNGTPYNEVKVHEFTHASHPEQQERYINEVIFNKNTPNVVDGHNNSSIDNARELYGALQEFRYKNKLKPNQVINQKYINSHRKLFKGTYLENISDKNKIRLFNEVAQYEPNKNNDTFNYYA